jgi:hypothetical protein
MIEQQPTGGSSAVPDEAALFASLNEQMSDPLVERVYTQAREFERMANTTEMTDEERVAMIRTLDAQWPYMNMPLRLSGILQTVDMLSGELHARHVVDCPVISNGFAFAPDTAIVDGEVVRGGHRVGHSVYLRDDAGTVLFPGFVSLDRLDHLELPFPSPELRLQRFAYDFPAYTADIDTIAFRARRDDQIIKDFEVFYFDGDVDDPLDLEAARDAMAYLTHRAELEPSLPYYLSFLGPFIAVGSNGESYPNSLQYPHQGVISIHQILLRPRDVAIQQTNGRQRLVPFIEVTLHSVTRDGADKHLLIPCSGIQWIESARYTSPHVALFRGKEP